MNPLASEEKKAFLCKTNEHPDACPKCGGEAEFEDNEESEDEYEVTRIRCTECNFAWLEYYRYEKWKPLEDSE